MTCFNCFAKQKSKKNPALKDQGSGDEHEGRLSGNRNEETRCDSMAVAAQSFNFRELATATKNFRQECLLGEGGFGRVYKGTLQATGEVVAVKQLDRNSLQGSTDFVTEVSSWSKMHHPNLVNFVGYCADGDQRLLVYEFMSGGSVEDRLRADATPDKMPMDWVTRMRIAYGAAQALEYLHDKAHPPVIYRDLKSSNVLLDEDMNPKLSHFGLSRLSGDKMPMQSRVMGTYGYCAPEYSRSNQLTTKADVYSFGIILLELVTGRSALDTNKPVDEQNLVAWALPLFRDPKNYPDMADPLLRKKFPERGLNQAVAIAAMCLQEESGARPLMSDVVTVLSFLAMVTEEKIPTTLPPAISSRLSLVIKDESFVESLSSGTGQDDKFSTSSETNLDQEEDSTLQDEDSDTTSRQSSWRSDDGGLSVSSSRGKNSKKPLFSISRKSSKFSEYGSFSSSNKGSRKSMFSSRPNSSEEDLLELGQKSTRKSKASRKSKGSKDYQSSRSKSLERGECSSSSSSQRIRRRSRKGIGASLDNSSSNKGNARRRNSRKGSQEGSVCNSS